MRWGSAPARRSSLTSETFPLACVQYHHLMEGRDLVRSVPRADLAALKKDQHELPSLWPSLTDEQEKAGGYKWGMSIDLNACNGCSACVIACQAENNIPVIGKEEVMRGREMHWLRVDTYHQGEVANPKTYFQPVPCMHCENGTVRARVPCWSDRAQQRRPERHGLQPLRRHALLLEQLPI